MNPKIKNAILFIVIALVMISVYVFFIKPEPEQANLVTTNDTNTSTSIESTTGASGAVSAVDSELAKNFLAVLLSVKNITLDDALFSDVAFTSLRDSSIYLTPDGNEGRPNPFAPIGTDGTLTSSVSNALNSASNSENLPVSPVDDSPTSTPPSGTGKPATGSTGGAKPPAN